MRLPGSSGREPDLQIILNERRHLLRETYMDGAADLCIEVVSVDSVERDHGAPVAEYWIVDPLRNECRFYRLSERVQARRD